MSDPQSDNLSLALQITGANVGTWGSVADTDVFVVIDNVLGKTLAVPVVSSNVNLTTSQRQSLAFKITGVLGADISVTIPLSPNSATVAEGGLFVFDNQTTGAHTVTIKTVAVGSTGVAIPQGVRSLLYSDGTNIYSATDGGGGAKFKYVSGDPNGVVTGTAGSATTLADVLWNGTTIYVSLGGTVWAGGAGATDLSNVTGVLAIAHGGTASTTAQSARSGTGLNVESLTSTSANASYTILVTDRVVATNGTTMTGNNTWTLPAANTFTAGQAVWVIDMNGVVGVSSTGVYTLNVARAGSDTINGSTSVSLTVRYNAFILVSDGSSKWNAFLLSPTGGGPTGYTASGGITLTGNNFTLDTNNSMGIGAQAALYISGVALTIANGDTTSGTNLSATIMELQPIEGRLNSLVWTYQDGVIAGVWRNISGRTLGTTQGGLWIRVS